MREITDVIKEYEHLRVIDLSFNVLKDVNSLLALKYLVKLELARNLLNTAAFLGKNGVWDYLKDCNLQANKITALTPVSLRSLRKLNLNDNIITTV